LNAAVKAAVAFAVGNNVRNTDVDVSKYSIMQYGDVYNLVPSFTVNVRGSDKVASAVQNRMTAASLKKSFEGRMQHTINKAAASWTLSAPQSIDSTVNKSTTEGQITLSFDQIPRGLSEATQLWQETGKHKNAWNTLWTKDGPPKWKRWYQRSRSWERIFQFALASGLRTSPGRVSISYTKTSITNLAFGASEDWSSATSPKSLIIDFNVKSQKKAEKIGEKLSTYKTSFANGVKVYLERWLKNRGWKIAAATPSATATTVIKTVESDVLMMLNRQGKTAAQLATDSEFVGAMKKAVAAALENGVDTADVDITSVEDVGTGLMDRAKVFFKASAKKGSDQHAAMEKRTGGNSFYTTLFTTKVQSTASDELGSAWDVSGVSQAVDIVTQAANDASQTANDTNNSAPTSAVQQVSWFQKSHRWWRALEKTRRP